MGEVLIDALSHDCHKIVVPKNTGKFTTELAIHVSLTILSLKRDHCTLTEMYPEQALLVLYVASAQPTP